jgi:His/Glu/Gln/Arg/opine family amino acid ABC transporter permease subunit
MSLVREVLPFLTVGAVTTVKLSIAAMAVGLALGLVAALARLSRQRWLRGAGTLYVEVIRGTPLLVQLFIIYYGLPEYGVRINPFPAAVLGLGINYGAYLAEVYRAGILSIDRGQWEAGSSLAMPRPMVLWVIIMPQAIRVILPPVGNYFISMLKDSALAATVSVTELLRAGQLRVAITFRAMEIYLLVAAIYLILSYPCSILIQQAERRMSRGYA